ncbi:hypothetical protein TGAM01_v211027 [Trichoderma gamsii]|uniref:Uncharacterized protein n=1 Tax=Trichoderma gamsii TaxID=398673 RepID=A0A2P4Z740_9HYPO|nr:hypothetical protein TGAM01_v211027 [Trichoderma gamsii]PON20104.1 hypothetical protein TGAM01_v211027 [Trichoderma gamsii]
MTCSKAPSDLIYVGRFLQAHVKDLFGSRKDVRVYQQCQAIARKASRRQPFGSETSRPAATSLFKLALAQLVAGPLLPSTSPMPVMRPGVAVVHREAAITFPGAMWHEKDFVDTTAETLPDGDAKEPTFQCKTPVWRYRGRCIVKRGYCGHGYLEHEKDLLSLATPEGDVITWLETLVEYAGFYFRKQVTAAAKPPSGIEDHIPVSSKFKSRYAGEAERVDWTPELIDGIISLGEFEQVGSEEEGTLQFYSTPDAEELARKREQHQRKPISADSLRPESLIRELMFSLQNESFKLQFFLLAVTSLMLAATEAKRENQLPFLVGYILGAAVGMDDELMKAAANSMNEINGFFDAADLQLGLGFNSDMISNSGGFITAEDGTVGRSSTSALTETNVAIWSPAHPRAFDKARKATISTRIGTMHSHSEVKAALEATKDVDQTFCLSVNNVMLVFSASQDEHTLHCHKVLQMLEGCSMRINVNDCVFDSKNSIDAGIQLEQVGNHKVYLVINKGVQGSS